MVVANKSTCSRVDLQRPVVGGAIVAALFLH